MNDLTLDKAVPDAYKAMLAASKAAGVAAAAAGVDPTTVELIRIRTSQINGCAFCMRMHTRDAIARGETADRLAVLSAWRDSTYFTPIERAALAIAEDMALIGDLQHGRRISDAAAATARLTAEQVAAIRWVAIVINSFNRIAITSRYHVGP